MKNIQQTRNRRKFPQHNKSHMWKTYRKYNTQCWKTEGFTLRSGIIQRCLLITSIQHSTGGASLVAQWLRIRLPMQGTWLRALVREDPTCRGATKPVCHNYWACALEPGSHNYWACEPQLLKPMRLDPALCNERSHCNEKPSHHNEE